MAQLRSRIARLESRVPRVEPAAPIDPLDDPEYMTILRAFGGAEALRKLGRERPECRGAFEREIEFLEREEREKSQCPRV